MKVPQHIRKKMHQIALYAGLAARLDREVGAMDGTARRRRGKAERRQWMRL